MAALPPICDFGWKAPAFSLPGADGKTHALENLRGPKGTLIAFICNHCPYVKTGDRPAGARCHRASGPWHRHRRHLLQ